MADPTISKRLCAEAVGTAFLLTTIVGSGIMADRLAGADAAVALLTNTLPIGAILFVIIMMFGPVSGAHFNPAVTLSLFVRKEIRGKEATLYIVVQLLGAALGVLLAHVMFSETLIQVATNQRGGFALAISEFVATFGLILTIFGTRQFGLTTVAAAVGLYIAAAIWFTASTSFANPAVTVSRLLTDTYTGIQPANVPAFVLAQITGAALAVTLAAWLWPAED